MREYLKNKDTITGLLLLGLCSFVYTQIAKFPQTSYDERSINAAFFPTFLTLVLAFSAVLLLIRGYKTCLNESDKTAATKETKSKMVDLPTISLVISAIVYVLVLDIFGFVITTIIYLWFLMTLYKTRFLKSLLISVLFSILTLYVFQSFFKIMLPRGFLGLF